MSKDYIALPTRKRAQPFRKELKVVAVLVVFVVILELISRYIAPHLDYDRMHISKFPEIVEEFEAKPDLAPKVLFYGNSLMRSGADLKTLTTRFDVNGTAYTAKITPVGTAITDWTYLYKRYFEGKEIHPDIIVVGFVASHISDDYKLKIRRLGRHFLAQSDQPEIWNEDLHDFHARAQTSLSHYSSLIGDQPEHQLNALDWMMNEYRGGLRLNSSFVDGHNARKAKARKLAQEKAGVEQAKAQASTFKRLARFIELAKSHNVEVWFVPMPQPEHYPIDQQVIELVEKEGMKFVDARAIEGITEKDFSDGYHLGETGTVKFTQWIGDQLQAHIESSK